MSNWQIDRLVREWRKHGKLIIACDFDDTLKPYSLTDEENLFRMKRTLNILKDCISTGAHVIIYTARRKDKFPEIEDWCKENELPIYGINVNVEGIPFGNDQKPYANIYLDDRAGVEYALMVLAAARMTVEFKRIVP